MVEIAWHEGRRRLQNGKGLARMQHRFRQNIAMSFTNFIRKQYKPISQLRPSMVTSRLAILVRRPDFQLRGM